MTNKEILDIAMQQSAYDTNAKASDFLMDTNVFVKSVSYTHLTLPTNSRV